MPILCVCCASCSVSSSLSHPHPPSPFPRSKLQNDASKHALRLIREWAEVFGAGPTCRHPQYYFAYDELRVSDMVLLRGGGEGGWWWHWEMTGVR